MVVFAQVAVDPGSPSSDMVTPKFVTAGTYDAKFRPGSADTDSTGLGTRSISMSKTLTRADHNFAPHFLTPGKKDAPDRRIKVKYRYWWNHPKDWILGTAAGQWTFLLGVAIFLVMSGTGCWVLSGGNGDYDDSFWQALWLMWGVFFDPGTQTGLPADGSHRTKIVVVVFSICGFVFNLSVLGLAVDVIRGRLYHWKDTKSRIVANDHILVLGWGDKTLFLLTELLAAKKNEALPTGNFISNIFFGRPSQQQVVILAKREIQDMREEVQLHLGFYEIESQSLQYRKGDPADRVELMKVSAPSARDILVMGRSGSDQEVIQCLLALAALYKPKTKMTKISDSVLQDKATEDQSHRKKKVPLNGNVFAEMISEESVQVVSRLLDGAQGIVARSAVNRMVVIRALVPAVGWCYIDFTSFKGGNELYIRPTPKELVGVPFLEASMAFPDCVLVGVWDPLVGLRGSTPKMLVPPADRPLSEDQHLVVMARKAADAIPLNLTERAKRTSGDACDVTPTYRASRVGFQAPIEIFTEEGQLKLGPTVDKQRTVIIVGCPQDFPNFLHIMSLYVKKGSQVHILSERPLDWREEQLHQYFGRSKCSLDVVDPHPVLPDAPDLISRVNTLPKTKEAVDHQVCQLLKRLDVKHHFGCPTCKWVLNSLPLAQADCVFVLSDKREDEAPIAADSRNLTTVITLRSLTEQPAGSQQMHKRFKVVTELLDPKSQQVVENNDAVRRLGSFVYSNALETGVFAMAAEEKSVYNILMHLLTPGRGTEHIVSHRVGEFLTGQYETLCYEELHLRVFEKLGGVLLGWHKKSPRPGRPGGDRYPELNPPGKKIPQDWRADSSDEVLVLQPHLKPATPDQADEPRPSPNAAHSPHTENASDASTIMSSSVPIVGDEAVRGGLATLGPADIPPLKDDTVVSPHCVPALI